MKINSEMISLTTDTNTKSVKDVSQDFEGMIVGELMKEFRKTIPKNELVNGGFGEEIFTSMLDNAFAQEIAKRGTFKISEMVAGNFNQNEEIYDRPMTDQKMAQRINIRMTQLKGSVENPLEGRISSKFGMRIHPIKQRPMIHKGIDIAAIEGTPIKAALGGKVTFSGESGGYGNLVIIKNGVYETRYAHCKDLNVKAGDQIKIGDQVGTVGSTGESTGPHLHFETRIEGIAINPEQILQWDQGKQLNQITSRGKILR